MCHLLLSFLQNMNRSARDRKKVPEFKGSRVKDKVCQRFRNAPYSDIGTAGENSPSIVLVIQSMSPADTSSSGVRTTLTVIGVFSPVSSCRLLSPQALSSLPYGLGHSLRSLCHQSDFSISHPLASHQAFAAAYQDSLYGVISGIGVVTFGLT